MFADVKIKGDGMRTTELIVNGVDLSDCVTKAEYIHEAGVLPILRLTFALDKVSVQYPCRLKLPKEVIECLSKSQRDELLAGNPALCDD